MIVPFNRRDSGFAAIATGLVAGVGLVTYAPAQPLLAWSACA